MVAQIVVAPQLTMRLWCQCGAFARSGIGCAVEHSYCAHGAKLLYAGIFCAHMGICVGPFLENKAACTSRSSQQRACMSESGKSKHAGRQHILLSS
eukprot:1161454-Pelagomonas_calceolata.AAC.9